MNNLLIRTSLLALFVCCFSLTASNTQAQWVTTGNAASGGEVLGTTTNFPLSFITGSGGPNTRMTIDPSGNLGIGTPGPLALTHMYSISSAGDQTALRLQSATFTDGFGKDQIEFWSNPISSGNEWRPALIYSTDFGGFRGGLAFAINGNGSGQKTNVIEKMRIVNEGVGINTPTPSEALDVVGNVRFSGALMPNNLPGSSGDILVSQGSGTAPIWTNLGTGWLVGGNNISTPATQWLGTINNFDLRVKTNNTDAMVITSGQLVGIGTTAPVDKLEVDGNIRVGNPGAGTAVPGAQWPLNTDVIKFSGAAGGAGTGAFDNDNSDPIWIGRVNVGTDNSELRINIGDNATIAPPAPINEDRLNIGAENNAGVFLSRMVLTSANGFLGVGTTTPLNKIDAAGSVVIGTANAGLFAAPTNGLLVEGRPGIGTNNPLNKLDVAGSVVIGTANAGLFAAPTNGLLVEGRTGIGTNNPGNKLEVNNATGPRALTSGVRLKDLAGWVACAGATNFNGAPGSNGYVLSVNCMGDIIITRDCCHTDNPPVMPEKDWSETINQQKIEIENLKDKLTKLETLLGTLLQKNGVSQNQTNVIEFNQNDPNPFSNSTSIRYSIPETITHAKLIISDFESGKEIQSFELDHAKTGIVEFNAHNVSSGVYIYRIISDQTQTEYKKMVVVK